MTVDDFQTFLKGAGMDRVAYLVGKYPDVVEPFLGKIEERLIAKGLLKRVAPVSVALPSRTGRGKQAQGSGGEYVHPRDSMGSSGSRELTDREAWGMLADLVDKALGDQPVALRAALKQAFQAEAAQAA